VKGGFLMMPAKVVGVMIGKNTPLPDYTELVHKYYFKILFFKPEDINWRTCRVSGLYLTRYGLYRKIMPLPHVIYNQVYPQSIAVIKRLKKLQPSIQIFNYITQFDKWVVYELLAQTDLHPYLPPTYLFDLTTLKQTLDDYQCVILKPRKSSQGHGIWRITLLDNAQVLFEHGILPLQLPYSDMVLETLNHLIKPEKMLIQKYISLAQIDGAVFDIRSLIQKNGSGAWQVTALTSRVAQESGFITNVYQRVMHADQLLKQLDYPTDDILNLISSLSLQVASALDQTVQNLGEISVDFGLDTAQQPWIIEVNGKPSKQIYTDLADDAIIEQADLKPLEYALYLLQHSTHARLAK